MFRFTIRDLLWLTVVVALAVGWWVEHLNANRLQGENTLLTIIHEQMREGLEIMEAREDARPPVVGEMTPIYEPTSHEHP